MIPEDLALVRNRDSWRLAQRVSNLSDPARDGWGDRAEVLVHVAGRHHVWDARDVEPIDPADLDRALMALREEHRPAYERFLAAMLGLDR